MSDRIDLTDESPPSTGLTLPTGSGSARSRTSNATAPSAAPAPAAAAAAAAAATASSSASSSSHPTTSGTHTSSGSAHGSASTSARATRRATQRQAPAGGNPSTPTASASASRNDTDDGFEVTGMSASARLAADRARRDAEETRMLNEAFDIVSGRTGTAATQPGSLTVHDGLPPGPHQRLPNRRLPPWLEQTPAFPFPALATLAANYSNMLGFRHHRPAAPPGMDTLIPTKHDRRMVLNHRREQPIQDFSFGIVEPPLDVESFEQDPHIVRGPLPDSTPICAGCDYALVLGGSGKQRMWALPCGHVIDGRCYDRYAHGMSSKQARQLAHEEVHQQKLALAVRSRAAGTGALLADGAHHGAADAPEASSAAQGGKGKKRTLEDVDDDDEGRSGGDAAAEAGTGSAKGTNAPYAKPVKSFRCPVKECVQRIVTKPNYPTSALELFI